MEIIIGIVIAIIGWIASHILSFRAQNKIFLNQIINNARNDIVTFYFRNTLSFLIKLR